MTDKPPFGSPCNGCGLCCTEALCVLGAYVFEKLEGPCPALEWHDGKSGCGLVKSPRLHAPVRTAVKGAEQMSQAAAELIGRGMGCDSNTPDEHVPDHVEKTMRAKFYASESAAHAAARVWGAKDVGDMGRSIEILSALAREGFRV